MNIQNMYIKKSQGTNNYIQPIFELKLKIEHMTKRMGESSEKRDSFIKE